MDEINHLLFRIFISVALFLSRIDCFLFPGFREAHLPPFTARQPTVAGLSPRCLLPRSFEASVQYFIQHQASWLCLDNVDKVMIFGVLLGRTASLRRGFV